MKKILLFAAAALVAASASAETKNVIAEMYPGSETLIGWGTDGLLETTNVDGRDCLKVTNTEAKNSWEVQIAYDTEFTAGTTYYITMDVKGDAGTITSGFQQTNGYKGCGNFDNFEIKADWNTVTIKGTAETSENGDPNRWVANVGDYVGTFYISNMSLYTLEEGGETPVEPGDGWTSLINGGKAADGETASLQAGWSGNAKVVDNPKGEGKVFECAIGENTLNDDGVYDDWKSQMFICFNEPVMEGDVIKVEFDHYCTDSRTVGMQAQGDRGSYQGNFQGFEAKPEWQKYSQEITVTEQFAGADGFKNIAICLSGAADAATFYINNVVVAKQGGSGVSAVNAVVVPVQGVYNLQGVKVANSLDEVAVPGLYISNGKKVIKK